MILFHPFHGDPAGQPMNSSFLVVGIGEALFDCFPDGRRVLGGAPLNVAFHADQLLKPVGGVGGVVSRVGDDEAGREIAGRVSGWGSGSLLQSDPDRPTGTVVVRPRGDEVDYEIVREVAWDYLSWSPELAALSRRCHAVSFGTLAQRSPVSAETIRRFVEEARAAVRLFDVNLRQNFYSRAILEDSCSLANLVKCNSDELPSIHRTFFEAESGSPPREQAERLRNRFDLDAWIVTRGKDGTQAVTRSGTFDAEPVSYPSLPDADPVGAGDGCTAAILVGLLLKKPWEEILALANRVGAWIASRPGATPKLPETLT